jgi:hypothetical protein
MAKIMIGDPILYAVDEEEIGIASLYITTPSRMDAIIKLIQENPDIPKGKAVALIHAAWNQKVTS